MMFKLTTRFAQASKKKGAQRREKRISRKGAKTLRFKRGKRGGSDRLSRSGLTRLTVEVLPPYTLRPSVVGDLSAVALAKEDVGVAAFRAYLSSVAFDGS
jgi:hypothetical protein